MCYPHVTTKLVVLLGNPLGHSASPSMHNRAFEKLGLDYCYIPVEVSIDNLAMVFLGLCKMNVAGFNVTIPHKIKILDFIDELDPLAATIGAVNTICVKDGKTIGYNTDGAGFIKSLEDGAKITIGTKRFFLLGCGGAARAIAMTLAFCGAKKIFICNRSQEKAEKLVREINRKIRNCAEVVNQSSKHQAQAINRCDILVNSTSLGMCPQENDLPIDKSLLLPRLIVADIVYNPLMTHLLQAAKERGCTIVPGLDMLIYQAAAAFKLFTGVEPPIAEMSAAVRPLIEKYDDSQQERTVGYLPGLPG